MPSQEHTHKSSFGLQQLTPSLLFQFILMRWISIHKDLIKMKTYVDQPQDIKSRDLNTLLQRLVGVSLQAPTSLPWHQSQGVLIALQEGCDQLALSLKPATKLADVIRKGVNSCQAALALTPYHQGTHLNETEIEELSRPLRRTLTSMKQFSSALTKVFPLFRQDENALFFILRHAPHLDSYYGKGFTYRTLSKMFDGGLKEVNQFLATSFKERGFQQLMPVISEKLEELHGSQR